jgi:iron only hydrogenase large subunit-like protein
MFVLRPVLCHAAALLSCAAAKEAAKDGRVVIAQIAPAVRVAMGETMGLAPGEVTVGQIVTGLRQLGFDYVFGELVQTSLHRRSTLGACTAGLLAIGSPSGWMPHSASSFS